ncbi:MAG: DUF3256 family protein [Porphyromonas sp.]|nr:DUF3256 family protein [Porphyromonas sp.]
MRKTLYLLLFVIGSLTAMGQKPVMRDLFVSMPREVMPSLTEETKQQLVDNYDALQKGEIPVRNARSLFFAPAKVTRLTDTYIEVTLDTASTLQLKRVPARRGGYLISMVLTSEEAPKQSVILFYDKKWNKRPTPDAIERLSVSDFLMDKKALSHNEVKQMFGALGTLAYLYHWSPDRDELQVRLTSFDTDINKGLFPQAKKWLKPEGVTLMWHRGKLKIER